MRSARNVLTLCVFLAALIALNIVTTTLGDESSRLTVVNKTGAYLHVFIDDADYPYVAPDRIVTHTASAREEFYVQAFYSPGQGRSDTIIDSTFAIPFTPASSRTTGDHCSCEDPNSSASCSEDTGVITRPAQGGSANWEITDSLFVD